MKNLKQISKIAAMAFLMLFAAQNAFAQYYVNMDVSSGTGSIYLCQGSTYVVTFTGLPSGYSVYNNSGEYSWSNGTPSCISYGTSSVQLCLNSASDNSAYVTANYGGNDPVYFTANFYPYTTQIYGTANFCSSSNETFTCGTNVPGVGTNGYTWTKPSFLSGTSNTATFATTTTGGGSGNVGVTVSGSPGCPSGSASNTATFPVTSYTTTTLAAPGGSLTYSEWGSTCYYTATVPSVTGAEYYDWGKNSSFSTTYCPPTNGPSSAVGTFYSQTTYTIYVRATNPCTTGAYTEYIKETPKAPGNCIDIVLGEQQTAPQEEYKVYPNPANNQLTVEYPIGSDNAALRLNVYDMLGQKVIGWDLPLNDGVTSENISQLAVGLYVYTITSGSDIVNRGKIIVQR